VPDDVASQGKESEDYYRRMLARGMTGEQATAALATPEIQETVKIQRNWNAAVDYYGSSDAIPATVKALIQAGEIIDFSKGEIEVDCPTSSAGGCQLFAPGKDPAAVAAVAKLAFDRGAADFNRLSALTPPLSSEDQASLDAATVQIKGAFKVWMLCGAYSENPFLAYNEAAKALFGTSEPGTQSRLTSLLVNDSINTMRSLQDVAAIATLGKTLGALGSVLKEAGDLSIAAFGPYGVPEKWVGEAAGVTLIGLAAKWDMSIELAARIVNLGPIGENALQQADAIIKAAGAESWSGRALASLLEAEGVVVPASGNISRATVCANGCSLAVKSAEEQAWVRQIMSAGDQSGAMTENLLESIFAREGTLISGGKYGSNNGFDAVVKMANGDIVVVVEGKQMTGGGGFQLGSAYGGNTQLSPGWIEGVLSKIQGTEAEKVIRSAIETGTLKTIVGGAID
jgi:hypothetical protein